MAARARADAKPSATSRGSPTFHVSGLAVALGVDQAMVSRWKATGMPFGKNGRISLAAAVRWLREHERRDRPRGESSERAARREEAETELLELRLARERGDVVPADEVVAAAEDEAARVRGILTQLPSEFAPIIAARVGGTLRDASAVLREIADALCGRLAASDDGDGADDGDEEAAG